MPSERSAPLPRGWPVSNGMGGRFAPEYASWPMRLLSPLHGLSFAPDALERGLCELENRTREAAEAMVTGVPTFMLSNWPMGGIQDDDTMVSLIRRFANRARQRGAA